MNGFPFWWVKHMGQNKDRRMWYRKESLSADGSHCPTCSRKLMNECVCLTVGYKDWWPAAPGNKHNLPKRPHRCRHMALNDCFVWNNTGPLRLQPQINLENEARIPALEDVRRRQHQRASVWRAVFGETLPWAWEPAFISHSTPTLCDCVGSVNKAEFPFLLSFQFFHCFYFTLCLWIELPRPTVSISVITDIFLRCCSLCDKLHHQYAYI